MSERDGGSTLPLILGFFLIALMMIAGSIAAGDAFVQQRGLQDVCDGAAIASASTAVDLTRGADFGSGGALQFADVERAAADYFDRDPARRDVHVIAGIGDGASTLTLTCTQTEPIVFGSIFGEGNGVHHVVTSTARAPLS